MCLALLASAYDASADSGIFALQFSHHLPMVDLTCLASFAPFNLNGLSGLTQSRWRAPRRFERSVALFLIFSLVVAAT